MEDLILVKDTHDLEELERNYELYNSQSYNYRKMADDQSIALYGDDNDNRYTKIKASILQHQPEEQIAGSVANLESSDLDTTLLNYDFKAAKAKEAEYQSGAVLIYLPIEDFLSIDYENMLIKLDQKYKEYYDQSESLRSIADDYTFSIFNTDNPNLYFKLKTKILQDKEGYLLDKKDASTVDQYRSTVNFEMAKYPFDTILSEALSIDIETIENPQHRYQYRKDLNNALATNYSEEIPTIVPNMFPEELLDLGILNKDNFYKVNTDISDDTFLSEYFHGIFMDPYKYKNLVEENYRKLKDDYDTYAQKLLELAWNPEVEPTMENYKKARENMVKYVNAKMESVNILNVSRYDIDDIVTEADSIPNNVTFSKSFSDEKKVADTLTKEELKFLTNGYELEDSSCVKYRETLKIDGKPVAFIEVFCPDEKDKSKGEILLACVKEYRRKGYPSILIKRAKKELPKLGITNLTWGAKKDNKTSLKLGEKHGFKNFKLSKDGKDYTSSLSLKESTILSETTKFDNELYPVFVTCTYTYTPMGKLIRKVTNSQFSHAAIGFDSGLQTLYSFNMATPKKHGGLSFESLDGYINDNRKAEMFVGCVFLNRIDYERIRSNVNWYIANYDKCNYSIGNLLLLLVNKAKTKKYQMNMICSQFVDSLFKLVNIDLTGKSSNLVQPQDFRKITDNSTVYILYDGLAVNYNMPKTDKKIRALISKIKRGKVEDDVNKTMVNPTLAIVAESSSYYSELEVSSFFEKAIPFKIDDKFITIDKPQDFETEYQKSHKLLIEYDKNGSYEPMKEELCKLWFMNIKLEKKIHKPSCKDKKTLINLRSRILNDFKKYIKSVLKEDPDFDFTAYYNESDYSDSNIKMDKKTALELFDILKQIIKH